MGEDEVAEAMVFLLERAKLVVEGAGAVGVAALLSGRVAGPRAGARRWSCCRAATSTPGCWRRSRAATRARPGGGSVLLARLPDRPGSLAVLLALVGELGANLLDVEHIREGFDLHVRETAVQLVLETRGPEHAPGAAAVREAGYAEPIAGRTRERGARVAVVPRRRCDQRADHPAALVGLGVPLDAEHEPACRAASIASARSSSVDVPVTISPSPISSTP